MKLYDHRRRLRVLKGLLALALAFLFTAAFSIQSHCSTGEQNRPNSLGVKQTYVNPNSYLFGTFTDAEAYATSRKDLNDEQAKEMLVALVMGDTNRDGNGRFAPGSSGDKHALLKTPAVHDRMSEMYQKATHTFMGNNDHTEYSMTVNASGNPSGITSSNSADSNKVQILPGTQAIVHTHPAGDSPDPGPGDPDAAKVAKCPNYVLSQHQITVVYPNGKTEKVADVEWKNNDLEIKWKG